MFGFFLGRQEKKKKKYEIMFHDILMIQLVNGAQRIVVPLRKEPSRSSMVVTAAKKISTSLPYL